MENTKRRDWHNMHERISIAQVKYIKSHRKLPSHSELADELDVSRRTIIRHMQHINYGELFREQQQSLAMYAPQIFMSIYNSALKGSSQAQKMLLQLIFNWTPPKTFEYPDTTKSESVEEEVDLERGVDLLIEMRQRQEEKRKSGG